MTIDAMENVPPEDWPLLLSKLSRAIRPGGHLYLTVEEIEDAEIDAAFATAQQLGWPSVAGEVVEGDDAGRSIVDEAADQQDGWRYWHVLLRT